MRTLLLLLLLHVSLLAHLNIAVSYPYIGAITKAIGDEHVKTIVLAKGNWDPHFVVARPSLIAKIHRADALIINGAQLEIGWIPPLIRRSNNAKVQVNSPTFLNLSNHIPLIQKPIEVDRSGGDVHPDGNPHFHLNPENVLLLADTIKNFLITLDNEHKDIYIENFQTFKTTWEKNLTRWQKSMQNKSGLKVLQFHDNLAYFIQKYQLKTIATIEPLPGIAPSSKHTINLLKLIEKEKACCILHDVYHSTKTADFLHDKTGIKVILMPHDIGALNSIESLTNLFDYLTKAVQ